jgi:hypothetical protein
MHYVKSTKELQQPALEIARRVSRQLELAMLLEVSAYPKPGNVHRTRDYSGTKFEHFLASAVSARPYFERAGKRGVLISEGKISSQEANIGSTIRDAVIGTRHALRSTRGRIWIDLRPMQFFAFSLTTQSQANTDVHNGS